jgi:hypothetical protein
LTRGSIILVLSPPTEAAKGYNMSLRRKLFKVWCGFTVLWWLICIFGGDGNLILLKFQIGGWRAAYVHLAMTTVIAVGVPIAVLLIGRVVVWGLESRIRTEADSN